MDNTKRLLDFIEKSTDAFNTVKTVTEILTENGFTELKRSDIWNLLRGVKYFTTANSSSVIAFTVPENEPDAFFITASHTDSPSFKLKSNFELEGDNMVRLSVEGYGGMIKSTWLDRPLGISGRVVTEKDGAIVSHTIRLDRDLAVIPNLAIHLNRDVNNGYEYNTKNDMCALTGTEKSRILELAAENAGVKREDILGFDLYLYNREGGRIFGTDNEYFAAPRIDDLQCVFATLDAFVTSPLSDVVQVFAAFDNEEVGSGSKQGAKSTFLADTLKRINTALEQSEEQYNAMLAASLMLSCDNAHALHPNHADKSDSLNRVYMNGGVVIKYNANASYTTDAVSEAAVKTLCKRADIPYQLYANRSDLPGGSTLGNLSAEQVSINTADIGLAQLAMHSAYETAGAKDTTYMIRLIKEFYKGELKL
ncbi:MAG: M18 family aminopeptidase [Clostridia bacterium]|nr:M18 family aminopeptidase [Clostridia bacterium]